MNSVNNGPVSSVRAFSNFNDYKAARIPYARNHDASFYSGFGGEFSVDVHRIFRDFSRDVNDPDAYSFKSTDDYVKTTYEAGTKVFYRLGAAIEHYEKRGTYPPADFFKWAQICEHIIRHYTEGWANGFTYDMESKHLNEVYALKDMENGSKICLPRSFVASKEYDFIAVYKEREKTEYEEEFALGFTPLDDGMVTILQTDENPQKGKLIFDADKIPYNAVIRNRREGDVFKPYNGKTKKLKDYFIDKKIPLRKRDFIPLVAVNDEVLLVSGIEVSDKIKVDGNTVEKYEFVYEKD